MNKEEVVPRLIAILRGIRPSEAVEIGTALYEHGFRNIEIPLNSPSPFDSIKLMRAALPDDCIVGAGTVLTPDDVKRCYDAGSQIIVAPNTNVSVISEAIFLKMEPIPGAATPTEAFTAVASGAVSIKIFPGELVGPAGLKAWRAVIPHEIALLPVGGVSAQTIPTWLKAGADGLGIGSALYQAGLETDEIVARAVDIWRAVEQTR